MNKIGPEFFDQIVDRKSTGAMKWQRHGDDVLPLWVADSDFKCAQAIIDGLKTRIDHGIIGYHEPTKYESATQAVVQWLSKRYSWQVESDSIVWMPGVISSFNVACKAFCKLGDKVLVQEPNYKPLLLAPKFNQLGRELVATVLKEGRWVLDLNDLERKASDPNCRLFLLCNPMNPCGTVYNQAELAQIEDICLRNNVVLCSDELHCDLILDEGIKHIPAGSLSRIGEQAITIMAANKTFNIAGLSTGFVIITNKKMRQQYQAAMRGILPWPNPLGVLATELAFSQCDDWYEGQLDYLRANRDYLAREINNIEGLQYAPAAATYLAWVDVTALALNNVQQHMLNKGIAPSPGSDFGWPEFMRINFACPRSYLEQAIAKLAK